MGQIVPCKIVLLLSMEKKCLKIDNYLRKDVIIVPMILKKKTLYNLFYNRFYLFISLVPFVLGFFMYYRIPRFSICYLMNLTHIPCPFCGLTRSFSFITHFQFLKAFEHNVLIIFFAPFFLSVFIVQLLPAEVKGTLFYHSVKKRKSINWVFYIFMIIVLLYGLLRALDVKYHFLGLHNPLPGFTLLQLLEKAVFK